MRLMAWPDEDHLCIEAALLPETAAAYTGDHPLSGLASDWLIAYRALQAPEEDREEELLELRRQWDQGTLIVDVEALAEKLLARASV